MNEAETTQETRTSESRLRFEVPLDLTEWADRPMLLQWVVEEIDSLDWSNPQVKQLLRENPAFQPRFLLALLTYAYSIGKYESEEVADFYHSDPTLRHLFPGQAPSAKVIGRFRREYRGLLKWSLTQVLKRTVRHHYELGDTSIPAGLNRMLVQAAVIRLDAARHFDRSVQGE